MNIPEAKRSLSSALDIEFRKMAPKRPGHPGSPSAAMLILKQVRALEPALQIKGILGMNLPVPRDLLLSATAVDRVVCTKGSPQSAFFETISGDAGASTGVSRFVSNVEVITEKHAALLSPSDYRQQDERHTPALSEAAATRLGVTDFSFEETMCKRTVAANSEISTLQKSLLDGIVIGVVK